MGALSGARHGGANQLAFEMLGRLDGPDDALVWAREALARGHRFPGFGHRAYKCPDPRVRALEPYAEALLEANGKKRLWRTYLALREEVDKQLVRLERQAEAVEAFYQKILEALPRS